MIPKSTAITAIVIAATSTATAVYAASRIMPPIGIVFGLALVLFVALPSFGIVVAWALTDND